MRAHSKWGDMSPLNDLFKKAAGKQIPGGCDLCDAYQTVEKQMPGMHVLTVHHDDWCPTLRALNAEAN
jgi:hypothetical protein